MTQKFSINHKSLTLCFILHIDGIFISKSSTSVSLMNDVKKNAFILSKGVYSSHLRLRGGGMADHESPSASRLGPEDALHQPIPKAAIDFRIRARKKLTNKVGKQLKRRWIGGAPIPKAQLRQEEESRRAEKNAAYARFDHQEDERLPTAKVDLKPPAAMSLSLCSDRRTCHGGRVLRRAGHACG
jgi:hypothetical protein